MQVLSIDGATTEGWDGDRAAKTLRGRSGSSVMVKFARRSQQVPGVAGRPEQTPRVEFTQVRLTGWASANGGVRDQPHDLCLLNFSCCSGCRLRADSAGQPCHGWRRPCRRTSRVCATGEATAGEA